MDKFLKKYKNNKTLNFFDKLLYRLKENDITSYGAGLAFFLILSIFPFLIALINIVNFLDIINVDNILNLMQYFPNSVKEIVKNFFIELNITSSTELLSISVLAGLFSASSAINKLIKFINNSYGFEDNRNFFFNRVLAIIFTLLFIFMILLLIIFYKFISIFHIDSKIIYFLWIIANSLIPLIYLFLTFSAVYRFAPCPPKNDKIKYKTVIPGSLFSTFAVIIATVIFAFYVNNFGKYSITYGSLGGIIVFLIWLFLLSTLILIGAEINIVLYSIKKGNHEENRKDTIIYK